MDLYFLPLACSMATRIGLLEAGITANYVEVDALAKTTPDGRDYHEVNALGLVPALRTDDGAILTENTAVLLHVERLRGGAIDDPKLHQWLAFIGSELHCRVFSPLFDRKASDAIRTYALEKASSRLAYLDRHLDGRQFLLDRFTVADAYLITILNWVQATPIDLSPFKNVTEYLERGRERPSVKQSIEIELPRYLEERRRAATSRA